jgi:hypothetical protein
MPAAVFDESKWLAMAVSSLLGGNDALFGLIDN